MTTRCHSVFSLRSPVALSRQLSDVATLRLAIGRPSWVRRISGSLPRFPTKITLFTLPAITALHARITGQTELLDRPKTAEAARLCASRQRATGPIATGDPIRSMAVRRADPGRRHGYPHI